MKNLPITITLPEDMIRDLHMYIPKRQISGFIAEMVENGLEEKKKMMARDFIKASSDKDRKAEIELWDTLSGDGLSEENAY